MVSYQEMTFGSGTTKGTVTPVTQTYFKANYGTPAPTFNYAQVTSIVQSIPAYKPPTFNYVSPTFKDSSIPTLTIASVPKALAWSSAMVKPAATAVVSSTSKTVDTSTLLNKDHLTYYEAAALMEAYGMTSEQIRIVQPGAILNTQEWVRNQISKYAGKDIGAVVSQPAYVSGNVADAQGPSSTASLPKSPVISGPVASPTLSSKAVVVPSAGYKTAAEQDSKSNDAMELLVQSMKFKQQGISPSIPSVGSVQVDVTPYAGNTDWQKLNAAGSVAPITQLDYAGLIGASGVGKWLAGKLVGAVGKVVSKPSDSGYLDDLKSKYDSGKLSDEDYDNLYYAYINGYDVDSVSTWEQIVVKVDDAVYNLNRWGYDVIGLKLAEASARARKKYEESKGDSSIEGILTPEAQERLRVKNAEQQAIKEKATIRVKQLGDPGENEDTSDEGGILGGVGSWLGEKYTEAKTYAVGPDVPEPSSTTTTPASTPASTPSSTPIAPGLPSILSPSATPTKTAEQLKAEWDAKNPVVPVVEADVVVEPSGVVVTKESKAISNFQQTADIRQTYLNYLNVNYPAGKENGVNDNLSKNRPEMVEYIYLGLTTYQDGTGYSNYVERVRFGQEEESIFDATQRTLDDKGYGNTTPWNNATTLQKRKKIAKIIAFGINHNVPSEMIANDIINLIQNIQDPVQREELIQAYSSGDLNADIELYAFANPLKSGERFVKSEEGTNAITGVALVAMSSTGVGLAAAPFAIYEAANYKGGDMYRYKTRLENSGMYPPGVDEKHGYSLTDLTKRASTLGYNSKDYDIAKIDAEKASIQQGIDRERESLEKDKILLIIAGTYFDKKAGLAEFEKTLQATKYKETVTNPLTGVKQEVKVESKLSLGAWSNGVPIKVVGPEGYDYTLVNTGESGGPGVFLSFFPGKQVVEVSKDGKLITSKDVNNFDETQNMIIPFSQAEIDQKLSFMDGKPLNYYTRVVLIPPGAQLTTRDFTTPITNFEQKFYFDGKDGEQDVFTITQKGKTPVTQNIFFSGASYAEIPIQLKDEFVAGGANKDKRAMVYFTGLDPSAEVYIDGEKVRTEGLIGFQAPPGSDQTIVVHVKVPGWELASKSIYLKAGESQYVSLAPTKPEFVQTDTGGGGGGGGGGSSGGGQAPAEPTTIVFGSSLVGCHIWLDAEKIAPEIGMAYGTTPGYHAFKAAKNDYAEFEKNVYVMAGKSLEVNAVFVAEAGAMYDINTGEKLVNEEGPGPVVVTSETYIMFGDTIIGSTVFIDDKEAYITPGVKYPLAYGYHGILIQTTGKLDWLKNVYLAKGDTLTVSPIFEDIPSEDPVVPVTPTSTTKRVFITSNPDGAKILLNDGFVGSWTPAFLDLERGLYKLTTTKTGYATINSWIWVGDVIAFGNTALGLARLAGMEV